MTAEQLRGGVQMIGDQTVPLVSFGSCCSCFDFVRQATSHYDRISSHESTGSGAKFLVVGESDTATSKTRSGPGEPCQGFLVCMEPAGGDKTSCE